MYFPYIRTLSTGILSPPLFGLNKKHDMNYDTEFHLLTSIGQQLLYTCLLDRK